MNNSPLSRMNGNRGFQQYSSPQGNRGFQQYSSPQGNRQWMKPKIGRYDNFRVDNNPQSPNYFQDRGNYQGNSGSDFIPFQTSSPMSQRSCSDMWQGSRGYYSGGYNNRRNNFSNSPRFSPNSPNSPFQRSSRQNYGKKNHQNTYKKEVDIKKYLDVESIFEDPWAELEEEFASKVKRNSLDANSTSECLIEKTSVSD